MTFPEAVKCCLQKYFVFSGRASRSEYWKFVLFVFLCLVFATIVNSILFGPTTETLLNVTIDQAGEQSQQIITKTHYNGGVIGTIISALLVIPLLAAGWRRLHDNGRKGWWLLLPIFVSAIAAALIYLTLVDVPIDTSTFAADTAIPETMKVPGSPAVFLAGWISAMASVILVIFWLCRRSDPGPNAFGPAAT